jgi:hypothetical protein
MNGSWRQGPQEYWQKLGPETQSRLQIKPQMSEPINYGKY